MRKETELWIQKWLKEFKDNIMATSLQEDDNPSKYKLPKLTQEVEKLNRPTKENILKAIKELSLKQTLGLSPCPSISLPLFVYWLHALMLHSLYATSKRSAGNLRGRFIDSLDLIPL